MRVMLLAAVLAAATVFVLPAAAAPAPVWPGTWQTGWGPLTLTQSGSGFVGAFGYADSWNEPLGHVTEARADGTVLTGAWSHDAPSHFAPRDHGTFRLTWTLKSGVAYFDGTAVYTVDGTTVEWHGFCKSGQCAADSVAPTVRAFAATGKAGGPVTLRWQATDASGSTTDVVTVYRGATKLWTTKVAHSSRQGATYTTSFRAPKTKGTLRFTVVSTDKAGNKSTSSASVVVR